MKKQDNKGFTLTEITIVVSIIGVLLAISVPIANRMREDAQSTKTKSELLSINTAIVMYYGLNGEFPTDIIQLEDYVGVKNIAQKYKLNPNIGG
ncbi:MAG: prepilin-type N-terminal cleavage/methylation domain-containing protein [Deltaproteobacteria bacterium]|nr:MAG: prepilin-type N-terminal cleavage/methylation domain-containing protein [Deltaproteobacteria bacterium]